MRLRIMLGALLLALPLLTAVPAAAAPPGPADPCLGAVLTEFDLRDEGPWRPLCLEVGGIIRLQYGGPGTLTVVPESAVDCFYAGGVHQCRLVATGFVRFFADRETAVRVLPVVVVGATHPPRPSTECQTSGTYTLDAADGEMPWFAICLDRRVTLRVEHHGPGGFSAHPAGIVSCRYAAGVRDCRFLRAGTVTLSIVREHETRPLTIVVRR